VVGLSVIRLVTMKGMKEAGEPASALDKLFNFSPQASAGPEQKRCGSSIVPRAVVTDCAPRRGHRQRRR